MSANPTISTSTADASSVQVTFQSEFLMKIMKRSAAVLTMLLISTANVFVRPVRNHSENALFAKMEWN